MSGPYKILLVEDNEINQAVAIAMLSIEGHEVDVAANGAEGVDAVVGGEYDLVLMDIQMPVMNGVEATKKIRALGGRKGSVPILAVTAHAMRGDREEYLAAGMDDYVAKPIDAQNLLEMIRRWAEAGAERNPEQKAAAQG